MDNKERMRLVMEAMGRADLHPLFDAMADDVSWRWMGVSTWSKVFTGKQAVIDELFGGSGRDPQ